MIKKSRGKPRVAFIGKSNEEIQQEMKVLLQKHKFRLKSVAEELGVSLERVRQIGVEQGLEEFILNGRERASDARKDVRRARMMWCLRESDFDRKKAAVLAGMTYRSFIAGCWELGMGEMLKGSKRGKRFNEEGENG